MTKTELIEKLFVVRDDVYAIATKRGDYLATRRKLTKRHIEDHCRGRHNLGLYNLIGDKLKWAVIDIDITKKYWHDIPEENHTSFNVEEWRPKLEEQVEIIKEKLSKHSIPVYVEDSGHKGYHLWVFFESLVNAAVVKDGLTHLLSEIKPAYEGIAWEIFPKQSKVEGEELGNLVKAPFGINRKSKKYSIFKDNLDISNIEYATEEIFEAISNPIEAIFEGCGALRSVRSQGIASGHLNNNERVALSYILNNVDNGQEYYEDSILKYMSDYDPDITKYQLEHAKKKGYRPITCAKLQSPEMGICSKQCSAIKRANSPIAFYFWRKNIDFPEYELDAYSKLNRLKRVPGAYFKTDCGKNRITIQVSNFEIDLKNDYLIDDGLNQFRRFDGNIIREEGGSHPFSISAEDWSSSEKLKAEIYKTIGTTGLLMENAQDIRDASGKFSNPILINIRKVFGYNRDKTEFYSPSILINKKGIFENDKIKIDLTDEDKASNLDLMILTEEEFKLISDVIREDLLGLCDFSITYSALAHTLLPVLFPFIEGDKTRYIYFLAGDSGQGKSFLLINMQNFFGTFSEPVSWSSTVNALGRIGYFFGDSAFLVDDFKKRNLATDSRMNAAMALMQNYTDLTGRARMKADLTLATTYPVRGMLMVTGEDIITGEASNLARTLTFRYNENIKDLKKGRSVLEHRNLFPGFTARYIHYVLNIDKKEINKRLQDYMDIYYDLVKGKPNDVRISRNIAILLTSFYYISEFLWNKTVANINRIRLSSFFKFYILDFIRETQEELPAEVFWEKLQEFLALGKFKICPEPIETEPLSKAITVAYIDSKAKTQLMIGIAFSEIQKYHKPIGGDVKHSLKAITNRLYNLGMIEFPNTKPRKFNGMSVRIVTLTKKGSLNESKKFT